MILTSTPFAIDGNLGKAYNEAMSRLNPEDWMFFIDGDVLFLTPDWGHILNHYVENYSHAGMFTCWTNRIHPLGVGQLVSGVPSEDFDIRNHIKIAEAQRLSNWGNVTEMDQVCSGMLMGFKKSTWDEFGGAPTYGHMLGVDNDLCRKVWGIGKKIFRMDALYVFHTYRAFDITDKTHLL